MLTEEPQTDLCLPAHADHSGLELGARFRPSSQDARPAGYHQVQSGSTELVPVTEEETVNLVKTKSCLAFLVREPGTKRNMRVIVLGVTFWSSQQL